MNHLHEQDHLSKGHIDAIGVSFTKNSSLTNKLLSRVKAGSDLLASVVPTAPTAKGWASALASSAASLRFPSKSGFHNITEDSEDQQATEVEESEKICL